MYLRQPFIILCISHNHNNIEPIGIPTSYFHHKIKQRIAQPALASKIQAMLLLSNLPTQKLSALCSASPCSSGVNCFILFMEFEASTSNWSWDFEIDLTKLEAALPIFSIDLNNYGVSKLQELGFREFRGRLLLSHGHLKQKRGCLGTEFTFFLRLLQPLHSVRQF